MSFRLRSYAKIVNLRQEMLHQLFSSVPNTNPAEDVLFTIHPVLLEWLRHVSTQDNKRVFANYQAAGVIYDLIDHMPRKYRRATREFNKRAYGVEKELDRYKMKSLHDNIVRVLHTQYVSINVRIKDSHRCFLFQHLQIGILRQVCFGAVSPGPLSHLVQRRT